ncbi:hypothetical protein CJ030_MR0G023359 [Morella rubra]|uniref:Uncharacterized protein n=1 Tax=Morella rubra TaxID=262757 RepID=A0A6A1UGR2_9ROSI|nr:hypothetical protein CJ030_MR0G023359 [Morella rubra]
MAVYPYSPSSETAIFPSSGATSRVVEVTWIPSVVSITMEVGSLNAVASRLEKLLPWSELPISQCRKAGQRSILRATVKPFAMESQILDCDAD